MTAIQPSISDPAPLLLDVPPAPRWARIAAHVAALTPLPSALWRVTLALGFSGGYTEAGLVELNLNLWGTLWVLTLSLLTEGAALLTLGLVQRWGEVVPGWVPVLAGRRVPPRAVARAAWTGVVLLALFWTQMAFWWHVPHDDMTTTGTNMVGLLYLPTIIWAPLLAAVTIDYGRRHRGGRMTQCGSAKRVLGWRDGRRSGPDHGG